MKIPTFAEMLKMTDAELEALDKAVAASEYDGDGVGVPDEIEEVEEDRPMCRECFGPIGPMDTDGFCSDSCAKQYNKELTWTGIDDTEE